MFIMTDGNKLFFKLTLIIVTFYVIQLVTIPVSGADDVACTTLNNEYLTCSVKNLESFIVDKVNFDKEALSYVTKYALTCANGFISNDLEKASLQALPNLKAASIGQCFLATISRKGLAGVKLEELYFYGNNNNGNGIIIEESSISQLGWLQILQIIDNNLSIIPKHELCSIDSLNLSTNSLSDISALSFGQDANIADHNSSMASWCGANMTSLDLSHNRFRKLTDKCLVNLAHLLELRMNDNMLEDIEDGALDGLSSLELLDLSDNSLNNIRGRLWKDAKNIRELNLRRNKIKGSLGITVVEELVNLTTLDMGFNQLGAIESLPYLGELTSLILDHNKISRIQDGAFENTPALRWLYLSNNQISRITNATFRSLGSLKSLKLNNNNISRIDLTSFESFTQLENLDLSHNHLKTFSVDLSIARKFEYLDISNNHIESLSENAFLKLSKLSNLKISHNNISTIPISLFTGNSRLVLLDVGYNSIGELLPETFESNEALIELYMNNNQLMLLADYSNLTKLFTLDISGNEIGDIDWDYFPKSLRQLNLSKNNITFMPPSFITIDGLTHLDMSYNQIGGVNVHHYTSLVYLNLCNNTISYLWPNTFLGLKSLQTVDLRNNSLFIVTEDMLAMSPYQAPTWFLLEGNLPRCDCRMRWILETANTNRMSPTGIIKDLDRLECYVPILGSNSTGRLMVADSIPLDSFICEFEMTRTLPFVEASCPPECRCYSNMDWTLTVAYCSLKNLAYVPKNMPAESTYIYLDGNNLTALEKTSFEQYINVTRLYVNASNVKSIAGEAFSSMVELRELHLENNGLQMLGKDTFANLPNLEKLYLQHNELSSVEHAFSLIVGSIKIVLLHANQLTDFPPFDFTSSKSLRKLTLRQNKFECKCDGRNKEYVSILDGLANKLEDRNQTVCSNVPVDANNTEVTLFKFYSEFCESKPNSKWVVQTSVPIVVMLVIIVLAILVFVYRHEMQVIIYSRYQYRLFHNWDDKDSGGNMLFDAFVAYSSLDEAFVVESLLPKLEGGEHPFRLCVHHRDFQVGGYITNSILDAIECSRRTIVVMSDNFAKSNWCRFEFKAAHDKMLEDRCRRLIMIVMDNVPDELDPEVKLYFKTNTYLERNDRLFWEKLEFAMPKRGLQPEITMDMEG